MTKERLPTMRRVAVLILGCTSAIALAAQINVPPAPDSGSTSPVQADLLVVRPTTTPCTVSLFTQQGFNDFNDNTFQYTPPAGCAGPYSRIVFTGDFSVTAGRQFDRTLFVAIGGVNVFFGTTQEPSATVSPAWHIERDVTDYAAALAAPQGGFATLGNVVDGTYTGLITGSAALKFYPADAANPVAKVPDTVLPLSGNAVSLASTSAALSKTFSGLPANGERVYLDVIAQSQGSDEFWWTCAPSDIASQVQNCGNSAFRETQVSIDGVPAGVAPIYPWIYTGGIDPRLWRPVVGVQTLAFESYRVDLTPFAGLLANGSAHTLALSVFNAQDHFSTTATLLIFRDAGAASVTGLVTSNTLTAAPAPMVTENIQTASDGTISGPVNVSSTRDFAISGTLQTSHGKVDTTVKQTIAFTNLQTYTISNTVYGQTIDQNTRIDSTTTVTGADGTTTVARGSQWPLQFAYTYVTNADNNASQASRVDQANIAGIVRTAADGTVFTSRLVDEVTNADTLLFDSSGAAMGSHTGTGRQNYRYTDSDGSCYDRTVSSSAGAVTAASDACARSVAAAPKAVAPIGYDTAGGGSIAPMLFFVMTMLGALRRRVTGKRSRPG